MVHIGFAHIRLASGLFFVCHCLIVMRPHVIVIVITFHCYLEHSEVSIFQDLTHFHISGRLLLGI